MAIRTALKDNNYCIVIFLDLKKVLNTFNHHSSANLTRWELTNQLLIGLNRTWKQDAKELILTPTTLNWQLLTSVLQGTILGPLLFICNTNDLPLSTGLLIFLFADTACIATD
jgi:hypothetical protein